MNTASILHEMDWSIDQIGLILRRPWPNRFHAVDWANGSDYDDDLSSWEYWAAMAHDHHNTLAHIDY